MNTISNIADKLKDPEYRKAFVSSQINFGIPFQLRALMKARGWKQEQLAERAHMLQPRISGIMRPGKTKPNIETLRRLAEAFDCGLIIRFAPFSELVKWSEQFDPDHFNVQDFDSDKGFASHEGSQSKEQLSWFVTGQTTTATDEPTKVSTGITNGREFARDRTKPFLVESKSTRQLPEEIQKNNTSKYFEVFMNAKMRPIKIETTSTPLAVTVSSAYA